MSFEVVLCHYWDTSIDNNFALKPFDIARYMAVMCFMFIAFLLTGKSIIYRDRPRITRRINRLVIMHLLWTLIYFTFHFIAKILLDTGKFYGCDVGDILLLLAQQTIFGLTIHGTMWFQVVLIVLSAMFAVMYFRLQRSTALILTVILGVSALILQYTGINFMLFGWMGYSLRYSLGRLAEMIPLACLGILCVNFGIMNILQKNRLLVIVLCTVLMMLTVIFRHIIPSAPGFSYSGLYLNLSAIFLTTIFYLLPIKHLPSWLNIISSFSPGVYCTHTLIAGILQVLHVDVYVVNSFMFSVVIFLVSIVVSFVISKIFGRMSKYLVG